MYWVPACAGTAITSGTAIMCRDDDHAPGRRSSPGRRSCEAALARLIRRSGENRGIVILSQAGTHRLAALPGVSRLSSRIAFLFDELREIEHA
jgi:hypothetical protein